MKREESSLENKSLTPSCSEIDMYYGAVKRPDIEDRNIESVGRKKAAEVPAGSDWRDAPPCYRTISLEIPRIEITGPQLGRRGFSHQCLGSDLGSAPLLSDALGRCICFNRGVLVSLFSTRNVS